MITNKNLLMVGAGIYSVVAKEIAENMKCFAQITFVDGERKTTPNGIEVVGICADIEHLVCGYSNSIVAIGNTKVRLSLLQKIKKETFFRIVTLVPPPHTCLSNRTD